MNSSVQLREELQSRARTASSSAGRARTPQTPPDPYAELFKLFVSIFESFKGSSLSPDLHALHFFEDNKVSKPDQSLVEEVFYGLLRFEKLIKPVLTLYYADNPKLTRRDAMPFTVLAYLFICRTEEGAFDVFREFCRCVPLLALQPFLAHLFDEAKIAKFADAWLELYDTTFVDPLSASIRQRLPDARRLLQSMERKIQGAHRPPLPEVVVPEPFNLSMSKPRTAASSRPSSSPAVMVHARPVPESSLPGYEDPVQRKIRLQREANRALRSSQDGDPRVKPFHFAPIHSKKDEVLRQIQEQREAELRFDFKAEPPPRYLHSAPPVHIDELMNDTRTLVLRQAALLKKKEEREAKEKRELEIRKRDATEFENWQRTMREQDEQRRKDEVQQRKEQMRQAIEAGIEAKLESLEEVRAMVEFMHQEREALEKRRAQLEDEEVQQKRVVATAVRSERNAARAATAEVSKRNRQAALETVQAVAAHKSEVAARRQAIEETAQRHHDKLVADGNLNPKPFAFSTSYKTAGVGGAPPMGVTGVVTTWMASKFRDPDAMPGLGFLGELSLNQVKARIAEIEHEQAKYLADKREELRQAREREENGRRKYADEINQKRAQSAHMFQKRKDDRRAQQEAQRQSEQEERDAAIKGYLNTFETKRLESKEKEQVLAAEWESAYNDYQRVLAERRLQEQKRMSDFELAKERQLASRQQLTKDDGVFQYETIKLYDRERQDAIRARDEQKMKDTEMIRTGQFPFKQRLD